MARGETYQRLIRAAIEIAASSGIENVTVRKISDFLDISEATMYRHFQSRDDLLIETFLMLDEKISSFALKNPMALQKVDDLPEELHMTFHDVFHYLLDNQEEALFVLRFRYSHLYTPEVRKRRKAYDGSFDKVFSQMESLMGSPSYSYHGFLINYIFELTLLFAEKVITGRVPYSEEMENRLWKGILAILESLAAEEKAADK